ncbi:MAG: lytic transglycosylase [Paracoccaceae bacterium]
MRRLAVLMLLILGSCATQSPPSRLDNACVIKLERPDWFSAMYRTEQRWGVPVAVQLATIYQESKFVGNAKTPRKFFLGVIPAGRRTSAYGYAQAVDGTWDWYRDDTGRRFAARNDFEDASDFIGWYMDRSERVVGIPKTDAFNQYLAYHEGHAGYLRGSHEHKTWLLRVAREVENMALLYSFQLAECGTVA